MTWLRPTDELQRYEVLGVTAPTNAHIMAKICGLKPFRAARTAVDVSPGERCVWSERVPTGLEVTFSPHDFRCTPYPDRSFVVPFSRAPRLAGWARAAPRARYGTNSAKELPT